MTAAAHAPFQILPARSPAAPFVVICEHASRALPEWEPAEDEWALLRDHWGWDIGAADVTRSVAARTGSGAVLAGFSRLVCDPNRSPDESSFVVERIEGRALTWNRGMDETERQRRRERYYDPYHDAVDRTLGARSAEGPVHLVSIHSFAPIHSSVTRTMEVGVLFDRDAPVAGRVAEAIEARGFRTAQNEPYSGYDGMIHSVRRHGRAHRVPHLEIEIRQDLVAEPRRAAGVGERLAEALLASFSPVPKESGGAGA